MNIRNIIQTRPCLDPTYMVNEQIEHIEQIKKTMKQQLLVIVEDSWCTWGPRLICLLPTDLLVTISPQNHHFTGCNQCFGA